MTRLAERLRERGLTCRIEARERLAVLVVDGEHPPMGQERADVLRLARDEGFTHVALELDPDGASLSRD